MEWWAVHPQESWEDPDCSMSGGLVGWGRPISSTGDDPSLWQIFCSTRRKERSVVLSGRRILIPDAPPVCYGRDAEATPVPRLPSCPAFRRKGLIVPMVSAPLRRQRDGCVTPARP